jgi:hypothetical protein
MAALDETQGSGGNRIDCLGIFFLLGFLHLLLESA